MSIKVMSWVWDNSPYRDDALLVHLALADWANEDGICWPNQQSIAHKARCSVEHVRRVTRKMESDGYLEILSVSKGPGSSHKYQLKRPTNGGVLEGEIPHIGEGIPHIQEPNTPHLSPKNRQEPSIEPSVARSNCIYCSMLVDPTKGHWCSALNQRLK
jgi:hypothetical protein